MGVITLWSMELTQIFNFLGFWAGGYFPWVPRMDLADLSYPMALRVFII